MQPGQHGAGALQGLFAGNSGAHHQHYRVDDRGQVERVGHGKDGRAVDDDVVVIATPLVDRIGELAGGQQGAGIGALRAAWEDGQTGQLGHGVIVSVLASLPGEQHR